jgi:DNA-binding IclR family transcriptional regulator
LSLAEISELSGYQKTSVYRIVSTLAKRGYLKQHNKRGKYYLGEVYLEYSGILKGSVEFRDIIVPHLIKLSRLVKESVLMASWDGKNKVVTEIFREYSYSPGPLKVIPEEGTSTPLYCTAWGKVILANMGEEEFTNYCKYKKIERRTSNTIVNLSILKEQFLNIKKENIAYDDEEYYLGIRGVASGITIGDKRVLGAICILGPSVRLSLSRLKEIALTLKKVANEISLELKYVVDVVYQDKESGKT